MHAIGGCKLCQVTPDTMPLGRSPQISFLQPQFAVALRASEAWASLGEAALQAPSRAGDPTLGTADWSGGQNAVVKARTQVGRDQLLVVIGGAEEPAVWVSVSW